MRLVKLTEQQVRHIATLARLGLTDSEVTLFSTQLTDILEYMSVLNEVDTADTPVTSQVTGLENVTRSDAVEPKRVSREALLGCSELPVQRDQICVKPAIE